VNLSAVGPPASQPASQSADIAYTAYSGGGSGGGAGSSTSSASAAFKTQEGAVEHHRVVSGTVPNAQRSFGTQICPLIEDLFYQVLSRDDTIFFYKKRLQL